MMRPSPLGFALLSLGITPLAAAQCPPSFPLRMNAGDDPAQPGALSRLEARDGQRPLAVRLPGATARVLPASGSVGTLGTFELSRRIDAGRAGLRANFDFCDGTYTFSPRTDANASFELVDCKQPSPSNLAADLWVTCSLRQKTGDSGQPVATAPNALAQASAALEAGSLFELEASLTIDLHLARTAPAHQEPDVIVWTDTNAAYADAREALREKFGRTETLPPRTARVVLASSVFPSLFDPCSLLEPRAGLTRKGGLSSGQCAKFGVSASKSAYAELRRALARAASSFLEADSAGTLRLTKRTGSDFIQVPFGTKAVPARVVLDEALTRSVRYHPDVDFSGR